MAKALQLIILFFACGVIMTLLRRLKTIGDQLGELHEELRRNNRRLELEKTRLEILAEEKNKTEE